MSLTKLSFKKTFEHLIIELYLASNTNRNFEYKSSVILTGSNVSLLFEWFISLVVPCTPSCSVLWIILFTYCFLYIGLTLGCQWFVYSFTVFDSMLLTHLNYLNDSLYLLYLVLLLRNISLLWMILLTYCVL